MSIYNLSDYRNKFFECKNLEKIHGNPDIDLIIKILRQCERNAQRAPIILGEGQLGYLALVIDNHIHNVIPISSPYVRPLNLGMFSPVTPVGVATRSVTVIAPTLTATDVTTQK